MPKIGGTEDPRPVTVSNKLLDDLRPILRRYPTGDQNPPLKLSLEFLKEELGKAGHRILGDKIGVAFQTLQGQRLITLREPVVAGGWTIIWISPDI